MVTFPSFQGTPDPSFNLTDVGLEVVLLGIQERFSSVLPVTQDEIEAMNNTLSHPSFSNKIALYLEDEQHIASLVFSMYRVIQHWKKEASSALVSTKQSGDSGANSSYFLKDEYGTKKWVFKPSSEEADLGVGIPKGEGFIREHLATLVNFDSIYPIPFTAKVTLFGLTGSVQRFVPGKSLRLLQEEAQGFVQKDDQDEIQKEATLTLQNLPVRDFQAKLIFDIIFGNGDAHEGNLLCANKPSISFYSIDHGNICSNSAEAPLYVPYLRMMPQQELSRELGSYCYTLPIEKFASLMQKHGFSAEAISHMQARGNWLSFGLKQGLTLIEIALPLLLRPALIHSAKADLSKLAEEIRNFRQSLKSGCEHNRLNDVKQLLENLKRGKVIPELVRTDVEFSRMWFNYLKPILLMYPESRGLREEIGSTI